MAASNQVTLKILGETKDLLAKLNEIIQRFGAVQTAIAQTSGKKLTLDVEAATKQVKAVEGEVAKLQARLQKGDALSIKIDTKSITASIKAAEKEVANAEKAVARHLREIEKEAKRNIFGGLSDSARKEGAKLTTEFRNLTTNVERAFSAIQQAQRRGGFDPTSESARKLRENLRLAGEDMLAFGAKIQKGAQAGTPGLAQLNAKLKETATTIQGLRREEPVGPGFLSSITSATNAVRGFLAVLAIKPLIDFANASREAATEMDRMERRLATLTGSIPSAREEMDRLRELSDRFGLSFEKTAKGFTQFAISAESLGLPLSETRDIFDAISIAASGAGASAEDLEGIFRALTQMLSKGTVQAEELRGQLGDRLPGAFAAMARAIGVTTQELDKMLKAGQVGSRETLPKFAAELLKTFGPAAAANIESAASQMARFDNAVLKAKQTVGAEMLPAVNELLEALIGVGEDGESGFKRLGKAMGDALGRVAGLVRAMRDLSDGNVAAGIKEIGAVILETFAKSTNAVRELLKITTSLNPAMVAFFKLSEAGFQRQKQAVLDEAKALKDQAEVIRSQGKVREDVSKTAAEQSDALRRRLLENEEEVTKLTEKELDKREKSFAKFYDTVAKLAAEARPDTPTADTPSGEAPSIVNPGDAAKLDELKGKLEALRAEKERLSASPIISADESNRLDELNGDIARLEGELRNLPAAAQEAVSGMDELEAASILIGANFKEFGKQVSQVLVELVTDNEEFAESFKALPPAAQASVEQLINQLQRYAQSGVATEKEVRQFGAALAEVFAEGGQLGEEFAAKLQTSLGGTQTSTQALAAGFAELGGAQKEAAGSAVEYDAATNTIRSTLEKTADAALRYDEATKTLTDAQGEVVTSTDAAADSLKAATPPADEFANVIGDASSKVDTTKQSVDDFTASLAQIPREIQAIIDVAPELAPTLQALGEGLAASVGPASDLGALYLELAGHLRAIAEDGPAAVEAITAIASAGTDQAEGLASLAESFTQLVSVVTPVAESLDKAKLALEAIQTAADVMPETVEALSAAFDGLDITAFVDKLNEAQESLGLAQTTLDDSATATERWAEALGAVQTVIEPVAQVVSELKDTAAELGDALTTQVNPALQDAAKAFADLGRTAPVFGDVVKFLIEDGPEGIREFVRALQELSAEIRDNTIPAFTDLANAANSVELPQG